MSRCCEQFVISPSTVTCLFEDRVDNIYYRSDQVLSFFEAVNCAYGFKFSFIKIFDNYVDLWGFLWLLKCMHFCLGEVARPDSRGSPSGHEGRLIFLKKSRNVFV